MSSIEMVDFGSKFPQDRELKLPMPRVPGSDGMDPNTYPTSHGLVVCENLMGSPNSESTTLDIQFPQPIVPGSDGMDPNTYPRSRSLPLCHTMMDSSDRY